MGDRTAPRARTRGSTYSPTTPRAVPATRSVPSSARRARGRPAAKAPRASARAAWRAAREAAAEVPPPLAAVPHDHTRWPRAGPAHTGPVAGRPGSFSVPYDPGSPRVETLLALGTRF